MDVLFVIKVLAGLLVGCIASAAFLACCKRVSATPTEQRIRLTHDWQAAIRRDVHRDGMRRASQLKAVK